MHKLNDGSILLRLVEKVEPEMLRDDVNDMNPSVQQVIVSSDPPPPRRSAQDVRKYAAAALAEAFGISEERAMIQPPKMEPAVYMGGSRNPNRLCDCKSGKKWKKCCGPQRPRPQQRSQAAINELLRKERYDRGARGPSQNDDGVVLPSPPEHSGGA